MGDTKFRQTGHRTAIGPYRREERERKHAEGLERNEAWRKLSTADKLASLKVRRGESKRQIAKLITQA